MEARSTLNPTLAMPRALAVLLALASAPALLPAQSLTYPSTPKVDQRDDYHGTIVPDPFRWLEQDTAKAVAEWVREENVVTNAYFATIPFREALGRRLTQLYDYPKQTVPQQRGRWLLFRRNTGLQNQSVIYVQEGPTGTARVLLDPNTMSADGTTRVGGTAFSRDGRYLAYTVSRAGSDWQEINVIDPVTATPLPDRITWVKVSGIAWWRDGFFYSRYDAPADTTVAYSSKNENHKVYYHRLGTAQSADELVFEDPAHPQRFHIASTTEDERWLVLSVSDRGTGKRGNALFVRDLARGERDFRPVIEGFEDDFNLVDGVGDRLLLITNRGAPNFKLVSVDPAKAAESAWRTILPEQDFLLDDVSAVGGKLFVTYQQDVVHHVYVHALDGRREREIALPGLGSVGGFSGERGSKDAFYAFSSFTTPVTVFRYDIAKGESRVWSETKVPYDPSAFEVKQVFYHSKDGTRVPMFIVARKGLELDGTNPTLLYGYGGFNISLTPAPNPLLVAFLEQGGVYAQPNLRGGGEYGERWHEAGIKLKKLHVIDIVIAAAKWLLHHR